MTTSKSPLRVFTKAYEIGKAVLRRYAHRFSPKKFTQPQLFAGLVLKQFLKLDYRGLSALLADAPELRNAIALATVPHFTTFHKASRRLLRFRRVKRLLRRTVRQAVEERLVKPKVSLAALDGTGLESHHASGYYVCRKAKGGKSQQKTTYARFPKLGLICDCASHIILAIVPGRGPGPDILHFRAALDQALEAVAIDTMAADAHLRQRGVTPILAPSASRSLTDTRHHWPTDRQASHWLLAAPNESPPPSDALRPTLASGNGPQHAQAPARLRIESPHLLEPKPRNVPHGHHAQRDDPGRPVVAMGGFLQSSRAGIFSDFFSP